MADLLGHGGREEQALPLDRQLGDDAPDGLDEAHVQHLVGLVEHEHLDAVEHDVALVEVIEQAAGGGDQHVDAARQRLSICGAMADAAEDDGDPDAEMAAVGAEAVADLAASSRVGLSTSTRQPRRIGSRLLAARRCRIGSAKAAVLPVPVWAMPCRSLPASTLGMAWTWIGVGWV